MAITESLCERTIRAVDGKVRVLFLIWRFILVVSFEKTFIIEYRCILSPITSLCFHFYEDQY